LDVEGLSAAGLVASAKLELVFDGVTVTSPGTGEFPEITPTQSFTRPIIKVTGIDSAPGAKYVVIKTDPDAPSKAEPLFREFIHFVATEVPLSADGVLDFDKGNVVLPYAGAGPPCNSGVHRYAFLVYAQSGSDPAASLLAALGDRGGKKAALAAKEAGLGDPLAVGGYVAQWSEAVDAFHVELGFLPPPQYRSPAQIAKHGKE